MMILPPVTPVMPIDPTRVYELVSANTEAVKAVLFLLGFIAFAIVSSVLTVRCLAKAKTGLYSEIGGSIAMAVAVLLFIRYGASLVALQGLLLYDLLLYASVSDIRTRKAEDWAWIAMIPLALCSIPRIGILSMLLGAGIVFLPQLAMAVLLLCREPRCGRQCKTALRTGLCRKRQLYRFGNGNADLDSGRYDYGSLQCQYTDHRRYHLRRLLCRQLNKERTVSNETENKKDSSHGICGTYACQRDERNRFCGGR